MKTKTKKIASSAAALGVALALGAGLTAGAGALWKDASGATEVAITAGNLDVNEVAAQSAVRDVSADGIRNGTVVDLTKDKIVPGDTWAKDIALDVALDGKNMVAEIGIDPQAKGAGDLVADTQGVKFATEIFKADANGAPTGDALATGTLASTKLKLTPADVSADTDGKADYVLRVKATFDKDTPDQVRVKKAANLAGIGGQLIQIREAK